MKFASNLLFGLLAVFLVWYAAYLPMVGSVNLGTVLVWGLAAAACVWAVFRRPITGWLTGTKPGKICLGLLLIGVSVYAALLVFVAVSGYANRATGEEQVVIVLGAGLRGERPNLVLRYRLNAAHEYAQQHPGTIIVVSGGQGHDEVIAEGEAMRNYLLERGMDPARILAETASTSTEENFAFSRALLEQQGIDPTAPIAYVSNDFHCYRAGKYAQAAGFSDARAIPTATPLASVAPCYLREVLAVLYYWVFRRVAGGPLQTAVGLLTINRM